ncbi:hypothetical protein BpHYR1_013846 [Brachionus plicatilis]|uniref:Uncharacterized protein n=1 Tax=Brachionus plicatilis TaxID=10195 RepID=A0A3M7QCE6_BRAPC|nr:hypothetical protein BpHYR1_013846 [Brachionus plicatilis]
MKFRSMQLFKSIYTFKLLNKKLSISCKFINDHSVLGIKFLVREIRIKKNCPIDLSYSSRKWSIFSLNMSTIKIN